jgi:hypothetical protein
LSDTIITAAQAGAIALRAGRGGDGTRLAPVDAGARRIAPLAGGAVSWLVTLMTSMKRVAGRVLARV